MGGDGNCEDSNRIVFVCRCINDWGDHIGIVIMYTG
jgi:hypothetical protein